MNNQLADLNAKYELSEKERLLLEEEGRTQLLTIEKSKTEARLSQRNIWILILLSLLVLTVSFYYFRINLKKKQHQLEQEELLKAEKQKALKAIIEGQEKERKRIAKDLHDGIGQKLTGLRLAWSHLAKSISEESQIEQVKDLTEILSDSSEEIRAISHKMMPVALREVGLSAAIKSMLENTFKYSDIQYQYDESNADGRFDERLEVDLYRICQELVNNAIKHSKAKEVAVQLVKTKNGITLLVQDDGLGVDIESFKKGYGFITIYSRLSLHAGQINLESEKGKGLLAQIRVSL